MHSVISIRDFERKTIDSLVKEAIAVRRGAVIGHFGDKPILASLFFEQSTRTRESFWVAADSLGMRIIGFAGPEGTSLMKGESLIHTGMMYEGYGASLIVMRHKLGGAARCLSEALRIPVINGGDGPCSHPTQTLGDLMTIKESFGRIDGLTIAMVGDLKYGRTVHSLLQALESYDVKVILVSPEDIAIPSWRIKDYERNSGRKIYCTENLSEALARADIAYITRIQRERFPQGSDGDVAYKRVSGIYCITAELLRNANPRIKIMHPMPIDKDNPEILRDVDLSDNSLYFEQAENGVPMRNVILKKAITDGFGDKDLVPEMPEEIWRKRELTYRAKTGENKVWHLGDGTLIDHIEPGSGHELYNLLKLVNQDATVFVASNVHSTRYGKKDVIGVHDLELTTEQLCLIGLVSERATINYLSNGEVVKKGTVCLPRDILNVVKCQNTGCVSRGEHHESVPSRFKVESRTPLQLRCHYCETPIERKDIRLYTQQQ